jgi:galactokinase
LQQHGIEVSVFDLLLDSDVPPGTGLSSSHAIECAAIVIDTKVSHSHADGGYASRRASCDLGAEVLGVKVLRDVAVADLEKAGRLLDPVTFRRLRHVVTENDRVLHTVDTL